MRHDLILRALRLPLLAALCVCTALVAVTAHGLPSREQQKAPFPRASVNVSRSSTGPRLASMAGPLVRLPNHRLGPTTDRSDGPIDWRGIATTAAESLARSGGMLGRWLVALREPPTGEQTAADGSSTEEEPAEAALPAARGNANHPGPPAVAVATDTTSIQAAASAGEVHLSNPAENGLPVAFLMGEQVITLAAGEGRSLAISPLTVRFDRGGRFGSATKTLTVGRYEFRLSANGWDIVADSP